MTSTTIDPLEAVKQRQRATWASGDYSAVAALIVPVAERLVDLADLRAGSRVLDVATGSANAAIAAARLQTRRRRDRLRRGSARPRPRAGRRRRPGDRPPRGRRRRAALPRLVVRRGSLGVRLDVRAEPRADRRRDRPRHPARRDDRACKLDARRLPRRPVSHCRTVRAAPGRSRVTNALGNGRTSLLALRPTRPLDAHDRDLHLPLPDRRGVRRLLRRALRPDAEGHRSCSRPLRGAQIHPHRARTDWNRLDEHGPVAIPATYLASVGDDRTSNPTETTRGA